MPGPDVAARPQFTHTERAPDGTSGVSRFHFFALLPGIFAGLHCRGRTVGWERKPTTKEQTMVDFDGLKDKISGVVDDMKDKVEDAVEDAKDKIPGMGDKISDAANEAKDKASDAINEAKDKI
jgi:uncharacterized protein YjbJ (UPF0337 family)